MRRSKIFIFTLLVALSFSLIHHVKASMPSKEISFKLLASGEISITGYSGQDPQMVIPSHIDGKRVVAISKEAFASNGRIVRVVLPEGLTLIEQSAFQGAYNLEEIIFPTTLKTIGVSAFNSCGKLKSIIIPYGVNTISEKTFFRCTALSEVILSTGVENIESHAFAVTKIKQIDLPHGIESIGDHAFYGNRYLEEIILPDTIKRIGSNAFFVCENLKKVVLPTGLQSMSSGAFDKCPNLELVAIPKTVINLKEDAFFSGKLRSSSLTITAPTGSAAESFANRIGINFKPTPLLNNVSIILNGENLNNQTITLDLSSGNGSLTLHAETQPETFWPGVVWKSSNSSVASVDLAGHVSILKKGNAIISAVATDGSDVQSTITINAANLVKEITIDAPDFLFSKGTVSLKATIQPSIADNRLVDWSISESSIASISSSGTITVSEVEEKKILKVTATARDGSGVFSTHELTIFPLVQDVRIVKDGDILRNKSDLIIGYLPGDNIIQLSFENIPLDSLQKLSWESSSKKVVDVDDNGLITGLRKGKGIITAKTVDGSKKKITFNIRVINFVKDISISGNTSVAAEQKLKLSAVVLPEDASDKKLTWESSDDSVAKINKNNGEVTAKKVTTAQHITVTATARDGSGIQAKMDIIVHPLVTDVLLSHDGGVLGKKAQLEFDLFDTNTLLLTAALEPLDAIQTVNWKSSDERVATVDQSGNVTLLKKGKVRITATAVDGSRLRSYVDLVVKKSD